MATADATSPRTRKKEKEKEIEKEPSLLSCQALSCLVLPGSLPSSAVPRYMHRTILSYFETRLRVSDWRAKNTIDLFWRVAQLFLIIRDRHAGFTDPLSSRILYFNNEAGFIVKIIIIK